MKTLQGDAWEVKLHEPSAAAESPTVAFKGALRLCGAPEYAPILDLLRNTIGSDAQSVTLDLRELDFLNSSGITMFSRFVIEARDRGGVDLLLLASASVPWHGRSLRNLERLMPGLALRYE